MSTKFYPLIIREVIHETKDCVSLSFDVPDELKELFRFTPGQYLTFKYPDGNEELRRSYSLCAGDFENNLKVAVKKLSGGRFSTYANEKLQKGDTLEVMPPMGNFTINIAKDNKKNYVFFASGSGITPIMSLIKSILFHEPESNITLFYGNRNFDSIIFREELEGLKNKYITRFSVYHILSKEKFGSPVFYGRLNGEKCQIFAKTFMDVTGTDEFMLCGPAEMIFNVKESLELLGVPESKIHFELFNTDGLVKKTENRQEDLAFNPEEKSLVKVILDGDYFEFPLSYGAESILDAALKNGADLPFACKGGVCSTCKAKLMAGEVNMDINYALEPDELAAGYVLTCQSHPRSSVVEIDFDQK
ncbi:MAG: phenylacetate-CoA oxygenase/reductase subunit PaaK [Saprospiraceae bacterium]|nr:phenylacetate-CoA oxygenase/reductase subunit PaaK [Saprospiraceae bacterium]